MKMTRRCLLATLLLSLTALGQDAAMFRGNLAHTGVYKAEGVPKFSQIKWKFHTDGQVISSPAVANGIIFVGSTDGNLYAVDLESGYGSISRSETSEEAIALAIRMHFGSQ